MKNNEYIIFTGGAKKFYDVEIRKISAHVIGIVFRDEVPTQSTMRGFTWYMGAVALGHYEQFSTVYRYYADKSMYQLSDDGSAFVPMVTFASNGGTLNGELTQNVSNYSDIVVPTPIDDENWSFQNWSPIVPTSGIIHENETYNAVFEYIGTPPVPEPTIEERLESAETDIADAQSGLAEVYEIVLGGV